MTFDDVIERVNEISEDQVDDRLDTAMWLIDELRKIYAPTVEMTALQKAQMLACKEVKAGFSPFVFNQGSGEVPAFIEFITTTREDELMYAWLHPELIKVVD